ncbi:hypothetical protein HGA92_00480 [Candidatus Gracilibacteria bacterium]|nr:hypothetical protein [Candidatus Gracilibacteria bacterium]NUJ98915.1 hypothetical protein [Candidatus Gracilibacteria bacterium]
MDNINTYNLWNLVIDFGILISAIVLGIFQYKINKRLGDLDDVVEVYATYGVGLIQKNGENFSTPFIHIQNVGTRLIYFDKYIFNGKIYELNSIVRPSVYSQAQNNYYCIDLPTNGENHVSVEIYYTDIDKRKWKSKIVCNLENSFWKINTYPREKVRDYIKN